VLTGRSAFCWLGCEVVERVGWGVRLIAAGWEGRLKRG
jgi:hypothetical protein